MVKEGGYESAAVYFKKANSRVYYSKAYAQVRDTWLKENFTNIVLGGFVLAIALYYISSLII